MSYSANEIAGLAQRAARGAGFPPRQAEVFGAAAAQHLATHGEASALAAALADPANSPILRLPLLIEDIERALRLTGPEITLTLQRGDDALAPAYARLLHFWIESAQVDVTDDGLPRLTVRADPGAAPPPRLPARIHAPTGLVSTLTGLAARTYVPASERSRRGGAGAGDIDND